MYVYPPNPTFVFESIGPNFFLCKSWKLVKLDCTVSSDELDGWILFNIFTYAYIISVRLF